MKDQKTKKDHNSKKDVPTRKDPENNPPIREPGRNDYDNKESNNHKKYT